MPVYEYHCECCDYLYTKIVPMADRENIQICPECNGPAHFKISAPLVFLDGTDPSFPGAYDKWARDRERRIKQEQKRNS